VELPVSCAIAKAAPTSTFGAQADIIVAIPHIHIKNSSLVFQPIGAHLLAGWVAVRVIIESATHGILFFKLM